MKKVQKVIKENIKLILGFILGLIWSGGIVYAAANGYLFDSDEVSYDNTSSGLQSENVQDALDELYANSDAYLAGLNAAHPAGSYLETSNSSFDPNVSIGGTWELQDNELNSVEIKLLWTNSNINSSFSAQTINIDLTYDYYLVEFLNNNEEPGSYNCVIIPKDTTVNAKIMVRATDNQILYRQYKFTSTGLYFNRGYFGTDLGNNYYLTPYKIYGIRQKTNNIWHRTA